MEIKKPNFFIIGAPKCGTTSLASWLAEHPQVYMSPVKEPMYYCKDFSFKRYSSECNYLSLFKLADSRHKAIGEASATYLFSDVAISEIERGIYCPKYIVLLRNPIEMAQSLHGQLVFDFDEDVENFEKAWYLQKQRANGKNIPASTREPRFLIYKEACSLGGQVRRLLELVPKERVMLILLDDIKQNTRKVWCNILSFLGLDDDGRMDFPVKNRSKIRRFPVIVKLSEMYANLLKRFNMSPLGTGILTFLNKKVVMHQSRHALSSEMHKELVDAFYDDIKLLGKILDRNLDNWLK